MCQASKAVTLGGRGHSARREGLKVGAIDRVEGLGVLGEDDITVVRGAAATPLP